MPVRTGVCLDRSISSAASTWPLPEWQRRRRSSRRRRGRKRSARSSRRRRRACECSCSRWPDRVRNSTSLSTSPPTASCRCGSRSTTPARARTASIPMTWRSSNATARAYTRSRLTRWSSALLQPNARSLTARRRRPPAAPTIAQRLRDRLLRTRAVSANQQLSGYLYFPLGTYTKGRVTLEDQESEEAEGFVVEF